MTVNKHEKQTELIANVVIERRARGYWVLRDERDRIVHECSHKKTAYEKAKRMGWKVLGTHCVGAKDNIRPWDYVKAGMGDT